ncbi:MAG: DUF6340 family protein [Fermentimonas sp.]|jgi:hypothetical protein
MKKVFPFLSIVFLLVITGGCSGIKFLTVETHEPAQVTLPADVLSLVVVNNVVQQPDNVGHNNRPIGRSQPDRVEASSDSVAIFYTEALAQFLDEEEYFYLVFYYNEPLRSDTHFFQEQPLLPETMNRIREETGADAVISLDKLIMQTDKRDHFRQQGYTYSDLTGKIGSTLRVYMPTMEGKIPAVHYEDSLRWEGFNIRDDRVYSEAMIPSREEAMKLLAIRAAEKMTHVFTPHWVTQERWYYTSGNSLMREGSALAKRAEWPEAIAKWETYYRARSNKIDKAKAASNIAFAHEMMGDMEGAYTWVVIANDLFTEQTGAHSLESRRSLIYKNELNRRRGNSNQINMQNDH